MQKNHASGSLANTQTHAMATSGFPQQKPFVPHEKHLSNPNIRAINNCYQIVRKDGEFKVVSNSLSQNFYN
jgi:hypothetical protein